jgi:hypothetical protein
MRKPLLIAATALVVVGSFLSSDALRARISSRGLKIFSNATYQGKATALNFDANYSIDCESEKKTCSVALDNDAYIVGETVPALATDLPITGAWSPGVNVIQLTEAPDSANDPVNKAYIDAFDDNDPPLRRQVAMYASSIRMFGDGVARYMNFASLNMFGPIINTSVGFAGTCHTFYAHIEGVTPEADEQLSVQFRFQYETSNYVFSCYIDTNSAVTCTNLKDNSTCTAANTPDHCCSGLNEGVCGTRVVAPTDLWSISYQCNDTNSPTTTPCPLHGTNPTVSAMLVCTEDF